MIDYGETSLRFRQTGFDLGLVGECVLRTLGDPRRRALRLATAGALVALPLVTHWIARDGPAKLRRVVPFAAAGAYRFPASAARVRGPRAATP